MYGRKKHLRWRECKFLDKIKKRVKLLQKKNINTKKEHKYIITYRLLSYGWESSVINQFEYFGL